MSYDYEGELRKMEEGADHLEKNGYYESARLVRAAAKDCRGCYEAIKPLIKDR